MSTPVSIWQSLHDAIQIFFQPLSVEALRGSGSIAALLQKITGVSNDGIPASVDALPEKISDLLADEGGPINSPAELQSSLTDLIDVWETLSRALPGDTTAGLLEYLLLQCLWNVAPATYSVLALCGIVDEANPAGQRLDMQNAKYLWQPRDLMTDVYGWDSQTFNAESLLRRIGNVAASFKTPVAIASSSDAYHQLDSDTSSDTTSISPPTILIVPIVRGALNGANVDAGFLIAPFPGKTENDAGIVLIPYGLTNFPEGDLSPDWKLIINSRCDEDYGVLLRPSGFKVAKLNQAAQAGRIEVTIARQSPWVLPLGSGFSISAEQVQLTIASEIADSFDAKLRITRLSLSLTTTDADGFLTKVLPVGGLNATGDLTLTWSPEGGLHFAGAMGFQTSLPLHLTVQPITLLRLALGIYVAESPILAANGAVDVGAELGPIQVTISGLGVRGEFDLVKAGDSSSDSTFGPLRAHIAFLPPTGAGFAVNAGAITGGGFLDFSKELSRYSGILQLKASDIGLVAIALITTKLPDGRKGYALFINIGVTFNPVIQLPYGFNLSGCGGLLALNRTMDVEALRSGLRNKTLDSILFPENPILNADKIISDSESVFPIQEGRFIVAPMAKIGWGENLIQADIAIVIELPEPIVISILGQITAIFPQSNLPEVVIHLDVLGVIEFAKKSLSIDATLYDSRIQTYDLSGDSALRLNWGPDPVFAMSLGGFHPRFSPPPDFPQLRRLRLQLSSSDSFDLSCNVYQALTSNTLQFGANVSLHAEACGVDLDGGLSFDTLIFFSPFSFEADIRGGVAAKFHGYHIASVRLSLSLSGPAPWHASGRAKVSVACWDATAHFSRTWGDDDQQRLPSIDPWEPFQQELNLTSNWGSSVVLPRSSVEALKPAESGNGTATSASSTNSTSCSSGADDPDPDLLVHPAGGLEVRQRLLPLALQLEKFGNADVSGHYTFDIGLELGPQDAPVSSEDLTQSDVEDDFARGQFKDLDNDERLSKPSFEKFKAGILLRPKAPRLDGPIQKCPLEYESIVIPADGVSVPAPPCLPPQPLWSTFRRTIGLGALQRSRLRNTGLQRFMVPGASPRVKVTKEGYAVVGKQSLTRAVTIQPAATQSSKPLTQTQAEDLMMSARAGQAGTADSVMVVPEFEEQLA